MERRSEAGEPTVAREQVCGPGVILTASVKGAREISAGRSPLAQQVARAVRARQNHAGGVPANCGSGEQVGRRPHHRAARRFPALSRNSPHRYQSRGAADCRAKYPHRSEIFDDVVGAGGVAL